MMTETPPPWERSGYADITAVRLLGDDVEVAFANGDVVRLPLSSLGIGSAVSASVEDGLAIRFGAGNHVIDISWMALRAAADPDYARHRRDLAADESTRLGRRLRALREDRSITQTQLAAAVGIPSATLSRVEKGSEDASISLVRSLLRELGGDFADIAGSDALEVSVRTIVAHATKAGVSPELASAMADAVPRRTVPSFIAQAFNWTRDALIAGVPETPKLTLAIQFKAPIKEPPTNSPLVYLALSAARLAHLAFDVSPYQTVPDNPATVRREAADANGRVTLASLLSWTWSKGIPVLPLAGTGGFAAAVLRVDEAPTIVIKETRDLAPIWLFDLAHELGHVGRGHVHKGLIDVGSPTQPSDSDADEHSATAFALELLLPGHQALIEEIRIDSRGDRLRFKFAVERAAGRANLSPGLLGIVAAFALPDVAEPKDRWGSATNLAKPEGSGRDTVRAVARNRARLDRLSDVDAALIRTAVLGG